MFSVLKGGISMDSALAAQLAAYFEENQLSGVVRVTCKDQVLHQQRFGYADRERQLWLPNFAGNMVSTTGCGDAFMAALVWAYLQGSDLEQTALAGLAAGSIAMESGETINPAMSATAIRSRMGK